MATVARETIPLPPMYILFKSHIRQRGVTPAHLKQSTQFADSNINLHSSLSRDPPIPAC